MTANGMETDFRALAERYRQNANGLLDSAAERLGVSVESLRRLGAGWDGQAVTFPMMDETRSVIGIRLRFPDGRKLAVKDSRSGLFIPADLPESGPVFLTEGPTDTAAVLSLGLACIGRPSAADGVGAVKAICERAAIAAGVVVGDNDEPGRIGAEKLAGELAGIVADVRIVYPADGYKDIRDEYRAGGLTADILRDRAAKAERVTVFDGVSVGASSSGDWPELISLDDPELPDFPVDGLPGPLGDMVLAVAESLSVTVDMPAMIGLSVGGLCLSKRVIVNLKPDWTELPNLYTLIFLDSGERKSPTVKAMTEPLEQFEIEENDRRAEDIRESHRKMDLLKKRIEKLSAKAAGIDDDTERRGIETTIHELDNELAELEIVHPVRLLTGDCTPERLATLLYQNNGRIGIIMAESILNTLTGRQYSSNGESNLSGVLSGYSGDTIRIDRQGREPIIIRQPEVTLCLCIQYEILRSLRKVPAFRGQGFLSRFCYVLPKSMQGNQPFDTVPITESVRTIYHAAVLRLLQHEPNPDGPIVLDLDQDARNLLKVFYADTESRKEKIRGDLSSIADWAQKLTGNVGRIAAILHGYGDPDYYLTRPIGAESMETAVRIGGYLVDHAKAAFQCMGTDPTVTIAKRIAGRLVEYNGTISRREIFERIKGLSDVQKSDDLVEPLQILAEHGYIRPIIGKDKDKGRGRPSERYEIRPDLPGKRSQNSQ